MHKEFLLVDGYNIIHSWKELQELCKISLESARQKLVDKLSNYQGFKKITVIVVFDAYLVKGNVGTVYEQNHIFVVFTKEAETADHYIERTVNRMPKHYCVRVATSDGMEQLITLGHGATRISARELLIEVKETEQTIRKKFIERKPPKNNLLSDNLDTKALQWLEELRRQK